MEDHSPKCFETIKVTATKDFHEIALYYANMIDYGRIVMTIVALLLILLDPSYGITIAILLFGSTLLDWVDGPVARAYKQSTVMGCGWDWLADILCQYALAIWTMQNQAVPSWFRLFTVLFTSVEISCGLFDFASGSKGFYPVQPQKLPWYSVVEHWLVPNSTYNNLGIFCWLVNTALPIAYALEMWSILCTLMIPFALLYAWHEVSQLIFIVSSWKEISCRRSTGIECIRMCSPTEQEFITQVHDEVGESPAEPGVLYWNNLFVNNSWKPEFKKSRSAMQEMVQRLLRECYPGEKRYVRSLGFITSPAHAQKCQQWHYDYSAGSSNLFIPLTQVTHRNATQFVREQRPEETLPESQYFEDPYHYLNDKTPSLEVSQLIARPFSLIKMFPSVMHRGISNGEDYDRIMFFLCSDSKPVRDAETTMAEGFTPQMSTKAGMVMN